jgi:hypothetical protein
MTLTIAKFSNINENFNRLLVVKIKMHFIELLSILICWKYSLTYCKLFVSQISQ